MTLPERNKRNYSAHLTLDNSFDPSMANVQENESGQASVEYAIVLTAFLTLVIAFGVFHSFLEEGQIIDHALRSSSHAVENVDFDTQKDAMSI